MRDAQKEDVFNFSLDFSTPAKLNIATGRPEQYPVSHIIYFDVHSETWKKSKDVLLGAAEDILMQDAAYHKKNVRKFLEELKEKQLNE